MNPIQQYIAEIVAQVYGGAERSPDAFRVAARLGVKRLHNQPQDGGRDQRETLSIRNPQNGRWTIYHDQTARSERQQFDVAHELIEQYLLDEPGMLCEWAEDPEQLHPDDLKELAHQVACYFTHQFLIQPELFTRDFTEHSGDLRELKRLYPRSSHEVLAYASLEQFGARAILTILDQPREHPVKLYRRIRAGFQPVAGGLLPAEQTTVDRCFATAEPRHDRQEINVPDWGYRGQAEVRAYPIFEPDWKRVILFLLAEDPEG